ncbi:hypothetical protein OG612_45535 (plasmid) [Streptomyces sp. NBC_01527]|uniref:hypothetical protein n=1 Tax=Streptomyces sp. NBC_01527 TaxID=2903894 RepID=UPI002F906BE0
MSVPECFTEEFAYLERRGLLGPSGPVRDAREDNDSYFPEPSEPSGVDAEPSVAAPASAAGCPEGDDDSCPTATCGCPPF